MTRRILITLGSTTDDERCGDCWHERSGLCVVFNDYTANGFARPRRRLPECIEAEKEAKLAAPPTCDQCEGRGWVYVTENVSIPCKKCKEARQ
jgi:hypothetical protein